MSKLSTFFAIAAFAALSAFGDVVCYEYMTITPASNSQGSGGVHALTDYVPKNDTIVRAKFASSSNAGSNNNQFLFCSRKDYAASTSSKPFTFAANVSGKMRWDYNGVQYPAPSTFEVNADYELEIANGKATITKVSDSSTTVLGPDSLPTEFVPAYKVALFQSYTMSGSTCQGWGNSFHGRFYYLKFFEVENGVETLKHWFVPCTDDGVVKICDLADDNKLYALTLTSSGAAAVGGAVLDSAAPCGSFSLGDPAGSSIQASVDITSLGDGATSATVAMEVSTDAEFTAPVSTSFGTVTEPGRTAGKI